MGIVESNTLSVLPPWLINIEKSSLFLTSLHLTRKAMRWLQPAPLPECRNSLTASLLKLDINGAVLLHHLKPGKGFPWRNDAGFQCLASRPAAEVAGHRPCHRDAT